MNENWNIHDDEYWEKMEKNSEQNRNLIAGGLGLILFSLFSGPIIRALEEISNWLKKRRTNRITEKDLFK